MDATNHGMCILHADFHQMTADCWHAVHAWYLERETPFDDEAGGVAWILYYDRCAYQHAVEQKMLTQMRTAHV